MRQADYRDEVLVRQIDVCTDRRVHWLVGATPACDDHRHAHLRTGFHVHLDDVVLPDATVVTAASFDPLGDPYHRDQAPSFGLYLDPSWAPPWPHEHLAWPDFGVPEGTRGLRRALERVRSRARLGDRVEIGCLGGHGRTGTALSCLAVITGVPAGPATDWVRARYCAAAVETDEQRSFVSRFADADDQQTARSPGDRGLGPA